VAYCALSSGVPRQFNAARLSLGTSATKMLIVGAIRGGHGFLLDGNLARPPLVAPFVERHDKREPRAGYAVGVVVHSTQSVASVVRLLFCAE
jgi:hypothetical protein